MAAPDTTAPTPIRLERCVTGRLAHAYPTSAHDVEIRADSPTAATLRTWADTAFATDNKCRRVVFAIPAGDSKNADTARIAGFRHVVDVDVADEELELWLVEPEWVTKTDMDLDRVPGS
jgi:hypothetical protein